MNKHQRWFDAISQCRADGQSWVMATIIGTTGSTPREAGSKMLITANNTYDTVGGGQLEFNIIRAARKLIQEGGDRQVLEYIPLAAKAKQCCGGAVNVLLECFATHTCQVHVFGAGHVAQALLKIIAELECQIHWVDQRQNVFPQDIAPNTRTHGIANIEEYIATMAPGGYCLVLTHDHTLDYRIISQLLDCQHCDFIGLIGSAAKALRFKKRLKSEAFSRVDIDKVVCPVGLEAVPGKQPMEVAVSIAAQLIQALNRSKRTEKVQGVYQRDALSPNSHTE